MFDNSVIIEGSRTGYEKLNSHYEVRTIVKKSAKTKLDEGKRTSDLNKKDSWVMKDVVDYMMEHKDVLFPEINNKSYQVNLLLDRGYRAGNIFSRPADANVFGVHSADSAKEMTSDEPVYAVQILRLQD